MTSMVQRLLHRCYRLVPGLLVLAIAGLLWVGTGRIVGLEGGSTLLAPRLGYRAGWSSAPQLTIEPYVRPEFARRMHGLRPTILAAAARHNRPALSHMNDRQFAKTIALLLYNEQNGWLEDDIEVLRTLTPLYQDLQVHTNQHRPGSDLSIWPTNLRPSVALEILRGQVPVPAPTRLITRPIEVAGSRIILANYTAQHDLFVAITEEISQDQLAVEYLAANLERGLYRADYEQVPVSWRTLAAWHNHGIVQPEEVRRNGKVHDYVRRTSAYLPTAAALIGAEPGGERAAGQPTP